MKKTDASPHSSAPTWTRWLLLALSCAICALVLTSCGTGSGATRADMPKANPPPPPPPPALQANQRAPCPPLPLPDSDAALALIGNHDQVAAQYHDCRDRADSLVRSMDEWRATAWQWYCRAVEASGLRVADCPLEVK